MLLPLGSGIVVEGVVALRYYAGLAAVPVGAEIHDVQHSNGAFVNGTGVWCAGGATGVVAIGVIDLVVTDAIVVGVAPHPARVVGPMVLAAGDKRPYAQPRRATRIRSPATTRKPGDGVDRRADQRTGEWELGRIRGEQMKPVQTPAGSVAEGTPFGRYRLVQLLGRRRDGRSVAGL